MRAKELACGFWLRNLALLWQRFKDASGRIKRQPTEQRYLTDSSTLLRTKNSRIKRGGLVRRIKSLPAPPDCPVALAFAIALMFVIGVLASYIPARRATRVDAMVALRQE